MVTRCNGCDAKWSSLRWEHCRSCHETFASTRAGDAHRVGDHEITSGPLARRCLGSSELIAAGLWATVSVNGVLVWHGRASKAGVARRRDPEEATSHD